MRALELVDAFGLDNLQLVERPLPEPGPGQVRVAMRAASLNHRDLSMVTAGGRGAAVPLTPLSDGCGIVDAVGPGVTRVAPGDRVSSLFFQDWVAGGPTKERLSSSLGWPNPGVLREHALLAADGVSHVPDFLSDAEAATLPCAALTAWRALMDIGDVKAGSRVLLLGTGGVSIFALQFARAAGCEVFITSSSDEKLERCTALGAHHAINYRSDPKWASAVKRLTGGVGVDLVVEVGGENTISESMRAARIGGRIAVIGGLGGREGGPSLGSIIGTGVSLTGVNVGNRDRFEAMCRAIAVHRIRPVIDTVLPWTEARAAFELMASGRHFGKIVLDFGA